MENEAQRPASGTVLLLADQSSPQSRGGPLWPWAVAGLAATAALGAALSLRTGALPWLQDSVLLNALISGASLTAMGVALLHHRRMRDRSRWQGRRELQGVAEALASMRTSPLAGWSVLQEQNVIDGYAVWDADDRLVMSTGFLSDYIPRLVDWQAPTARQLIIEMVDTGAVRLAPGLGRDEAIESYSSKRLQVPGLREFRMADGKVFLARTASLGEGRHVSIFTNITEIMYWGADRQVPDHIFREAFQTCGSMLLLLGADAVPVAANRAAIAGLGHSLRDLRQVGWPGLLHPDEGRPGVPWSPGPHWFNNPQGGRLRGMVRISTIRSEGDTATGLTLVAIDDTTARAEADDRLRLQAALAEGIASAVLAVDAHGRIVHANQAASSLFQWSAPVLLQTPVEQVLGQAIREAMAAGDTEAEVEGTTWNGTRFPAQVALAPLAPSAGIEGGTVLVVSDLTPRRALDLQLMHSARLATLGEMAASIAHEFNQCLHVIRLSAEALLLETEGPPRPERITKRSENILSQVDRLGEMVAHMRGISRRENAAKQPFSPQAALQSALRMVEPLLVADGIRVERRGDLGGAAVLGHQVRLEQVLLNLLNNARDAIRERFRLSGNTGGTITVASRLDDDGRRIHISVRDDGTGIPPAMNSHIFEPFFTTKDGGAGCGLGLSISRGICSEMGGQLTFANADPGAEFMITLPLASDEPAQETVSPAITSALADDDADIGDDDDEAWGEERRLLLVDDEALSVLMVCEFLERQGYVVDTAYDGLAALERCQSHVYHAVITDIRMPRMDGQELIARLEDLQPGTPVVVVTGHLRERDAAAMGSNVVALLEKPFQLQKLRDVLLRLDESPVSLKQHEEVGG